MSNNISDTQTHHDSASLIIKFIGITVVMGINFLGVCLLILMFRDESPELAIITSLISTIGNAVSLGIGVLIPSPLSSKRSNEPQGPKETPAGTPDDPVNTKEVIEEESLEQGEKS